MSTSTYPVDHTLHMMEDGPMDSRFQIPCGTLQYNKERDAHFLYIYKLKTHTLVHTPQYIKTILIHVVDTSVDARVTCVMHQVCKDT